MPRPALRLATCPLILLLTVACAPSKGAGADIDQLARQTTAAQVPVDQLAEPLRSQVNRVLQKGQLFERGKPEAFPCKPSVYRWLLDSPDASLNAWKKLGATK